MMSEGGKGDFMTHPYPRSGVTYTYKPLSLTADSTNIDIRDFGDYCRFVKRMIIAF